ncbi:MAG: GatB/YqeY domain-containing protein [Candidatus Omnitrophica bacterium]|nr:GatB/YqeY domain-containing protein [Candidatus Omnitrophota bacterium]MBU4488869.1 GatB/YqeY domain-containing protein [Candidatus Omnitrophota bacterium]MCG2705667.1 GatB/YqeY domain-containing protein [Candidatus Omnitrophota bacterium]
MLIKQIGEDLKAALKQKDALRTSVLRMLKAAMEKLKNSCDGKALSAIVGELLGS